jgi:hypothetical protein
MGDSDSEPVPADIKKTNHLVIVGSLIFFVLLVGVRILLI